MRITLEKTGMGDAISGTEAEPGEDLTKLVAVKPDVPVENASELNVLKVFIDFAENKWEAVLSWNLGKWITGFSAEVFSLT